MSYNIYIFDLRQWSVWLGGQTYGSKSLRTVKSWGLSAGAELCFNLGIFNMASGDGCTYVHSKRGDHGYGGNSEVVEFGSNRCKGYSNAIQNNAILINAPMGGSRTRNGIGLTASGKVIIAQTSHRCTEKTFAQAVSNYVARLGERTQIFVLEDGGGSTSSYSDISKLSFAPEGGRSVATVVYAYRIGVPAVTRNLKLWSKGDDVKILQTVLGGIEADGSFGFGTRSRLMAAQRALGLTPDGCCGPLTRAALHL